MESFSFFVHPANPRSPSPTDTNPVQWIASSLVRSVVLSAARSVLLNVKGFSDPLFWSHILGHPETSFSPPSVSTEEEDVDGDYDRKSPESEDRRVSQLAPKRPHRTLERC